MTEPADRNDVDETPAPSDNRPAEIPDDDEATVYCDQPNETPVDEAADVEATIDDGTVIVQQPVDDDQTIVELPSTPPSEEGTGQGVRTVAETVEESADSQSKGKSRFSFKRSRGEESKSQSSGGQSHPQDEPRYSLLDNFAHGGMGNIWKAHDTRIHRQVAYKELLPRALRRPRVVERFVQEAQITGQLEHPCIIPIYDLGWVNGAPFYAMKLIHGIEMKQRISEMHALPENSHTRRRLFVQLLHSFIDACKAMAFAHKRGVLHRDLKPQNIMLGEFGETLILDWGLARIMSVSESDSADGESSGRRQGNTDGVLVSGEYEDDFDSEKESSGEGESEDDTFNLQTIESEEAGVDSQAPTFAAATVRTDSRSEGTETRYGSVMGTLAYMPPEQAEGKLDQLDPRTDIYSLGAILYEILANEAPVPKDKIERMLDYVINKPTRPPIEVNRSTPRPLNAIVMKAMSKRREDRYATSLHLARDLEDYLADEPVSAYPEPWHDRARRWARNHRQKLTWSTFAGICVVLLCVALSLQSENQKLAAIEEARADVEEFERLADEAQYFAATAERLDESTPYYDSSRAHEAADRALQLSSGWGQQLDGLPLSALRDQVRTPLYRLLLVTVQSRLNHESDTEQLPELKELLNRAELLDGESAALHRLQSAVGSTTRAQDADAEPAARTALDYFIQAEELRRNASRSGAPGDEWHAHADLLEQAIENYRSAIRIQSDHFWSHFQLGRCLLSLGRHAEGTEALGTCIALRPDSPWSYSARGLALAMLQRYDEAHADFDQALSLDDTFLPASLNRGVAHMLAGSRDKALQSFSALLMASKPLLIEAAYYRATLRHESGDQPGAITDLDSVLARRPTFSPALHLRCRINYLTGQLDSAREDLNAILARRVSNPEFDSSSPRTSFERSGFIRQLLSSPIPEVIEVDRRGLLELALAELQDSITEGGDWAELFAEAGSLLELLGAFPEAYQAYSKSIETAPKNDALLVKRGWLQALRLNQAAGAIADFEAALKINPQNAEAHSAHGFLLAIVNPSVAAEQAAVKAILHGGGDYLILHNVACIYAELAQRSPNNADSYEQSALEIIRHGIQLWNNGGRSGPDAIQLATGEPSFRELSKRPGFQQLINDTSE